MLTGNLQIKNDTYYAVINYKEGGKYKQKWVSTKLKTKGNKRKATEFLNNLLTNFSCSVNLKEFQKVKFTNYIKNGLKTKKVK